MPTGNQIASRLKPRVQSLSLLSPVELVRSSGLAVGETGEERQA
jgi:hypothetical protein